MTVTDITPLDLRGLTEDELAGLYNSGGTMAAEALAEAGRRDRDSRLARARHSLAGIRAEGDRQAYAQFIAASDSDLCKGRLLSREGMAAMDRGEIRDELDLWRIPADKALRYCSEELGLWWMHVSPRVTSEDYVKQHARERRMATAGARDERVAGDGRDATARTGLTEPEAGALRRGTSASQAPQGRTGGTVQRGGRGTAASAEGKPAGRDGRPGRPVQRDGMSGCRHPHRVGTPGQCGNCPVKLARGTVGMGVITRAVVRTARNDQRNRDASPGRAAGTVAVLDGQVMQHQRQRPAAQQIDGGMVLGLLRRYLAHYVSFPSEAALAAAVAWIGHAVARDRDDKGIGQLIWRASPRLLVTSRDRGSGKSTLLDLIAVLTGARDGKSPKITPRAIAETVGQHYDVAILDEAKTIFGSGAKNLELQGCLLAGYTPRTSYRVSGKSIPLFGAVAYAGKDELIRDTTGEQIGDLLDRSIILRFSPPQGTVPPEVDEIAEDDGELLAAALVAWTDSRREELRQAARDIAAEDRDTERAGDLRSMQIWRPLRAICRVADGLTEDDLAEGERGPWETAIDEASWELTAGAAGIEAQDALAELGRRAEAWGGGDEPGVIVTEAGGYEEDE